jgi:GH25 family lysozyme M1 (1,4-beta-N-acetylmuramidase)
MTSRENPAAAADAEQHARQEIANMEAGVARGARHLVRWLAVPAGALAGWLIVRRRPRR